MKKLNILLVTVLLFSCGKILVSPPGPQGDQGKPGVSSPCTVVKDNNVATITCPDGTNTTISDGESPTPVPGPSGATGASGHDGVSTVFSVSAATASQCAAGGSNIILALDTNDNGLLDSGDTGFQSALVCNGLNGTNGAPAPVSSFSVVSPITPCGQASSPYKEVLLCLGGGQVLASFSDSVSGLNTRFAFIPAGSYVDTDSSGCTFNVSVDSLGNTTISWASGHNGYSTWLSSSVVCRKNS